VTVLGVDDRSFQIKGYSINIFISAKYVAIMNKVDIQYNVERHVCLRTVVLMNFPIF